MGRRQGLPIARLQHPPTGLRWSHPQASGAPGGLRAVTAAMILPLAGRCCFTQSSSTALITAPSHLRVYGHRLEVSAVRESARIKAKEACGEVDT